MALLLQAHTAKSQYHGELWQLLLTGRLDMALAGKKRFNEFSYQSRHSRNQKKSSGAVAIFVVTAPDLYV